MTGTSSSSIIENLSNRKIIVILAIILIIQIISFFIGAFIAPSPSYPEQITATKCIPSNYNELSIPRVHLANGKVVQKNCKISEFSSNQTTVFALQIPLAKEGQQLDYSRWMSYLLVLFYPDIIYDQRLVSSTSNDAEIKGTLLMKVTLAVRNAWQKDWTIYSQKDRLKRSLSCTLHNDQKKNGAKYDCDLTQLFELQSIYYDYYLINIQITGEENKLKYSGILTDLNFVTIHQNGGFTKIWLMLKSGFFFITLATFLWYYQRIRQLNRASDLIEKNLFVIGAAITQFNLPIEYLTLFFDLPFMNFLSDIRQGVLYCSLLCFWLIFTGEHLLDNKQGSQISRYYVQITVVLTASISLFIFDSSERGVQAIDPFFSIWEKIPNLAILFILLASLATVAYLMFLGYHIFCVFNTISSKQSTLPAMSSTRRLFYMGVVYRFKFLLWATIVCAVFTTVAFILSQVISDQSLMLDLEEDHAFPIQWSSAMFTSVLAMWNLYIITLLIFYAPSKKSDVDNTSEEIEFSRLTDNIQDDEDSLRVVDKTDAQLLREFTSKKNID